MAARRLLRVPEGREVVRFAGVAGALALVLLAVEAAQPAPAYANPVTDALKDALEWLFLPGPIKNVTDEALKWLVEVPNYIERPGSMEALGQTTSAIAGASLAAIATLAVVHYWAAGVSLSAGGDPVEAVPRTVGAGLFILAWPWIFSQAVALTNRVTDVLISESEIGGLAQAGFVISNVVSLQLGALIPFLLGSAVVIALIAVIFTKIALVATLALLFVGVPLAVGLYPLPSLSWVAQFALKLFVAILMIFITWALELAAIGALGKDFLTWSGGGEWVAKLTKPLIGLALLMLMMSTAKHWLRLAGVLSGGGGGMVRHTLAWAGTHLAFNAAAQHIPDALGGRATSLARAAESQQETRQWRAASDARHAEATKERVAEDAKQQHVPRHSADPQPRRAVGSPAVPPTSPPFAASNTMGNADSAYNALRPELQARVGELVHGAHTSDEVKTGLRALKGTDSITPMERQALTELGRVDWDTLGTTIDATPAATDQHKPSEPPQQSPTETARPSEAPRQPPVEAARPSEAPRQPQTEPARPTEPTQQPATSQPPPSPSSPPTPAEPPKR